MADRPILFSGPMVRAILDGRKTQTRRTLSGAVSSHPPYVANYKEGSCAVYEDADGCVRRFVGAAGASVGDRLWVKHSADCFPVYFKSIPFGGGKYAVGTDGNVYARSDAGWEKRAVRLSHNGYEEISLRHNGEQRAFRVNRLVAEAFYGPAPEGYACRHMDGSRRNNRPENLDWGTPEQNSADASAAGSFSGERASQSHLSASDVEAIRASVEPQAALAERFGVTQPTVSKIKSGKRWASPGEAPPRNMPAFQLWRSPIFCPRWASRLTLIVESVKVERLQDISAAETISEGVQCATCIAMHKSACLGLGCFASRQAFIALWTAINAPGSWEANPWVAAITFRVGCGNIDSDKWAAAGASEARP
jgi:hypothetical protein